MPKHQRPWLIFFQKHVNVANKRHDRNHQRPNQTNSEDGFKGQNRIMNYCGHTQKLGQAA
jgi:hypothetical protein